MMNFNIQCEKLPRDEVSTPSAERNFLTHRHWKTNLLTWMKEYVCETQLRVGEGLEIG